MNTSTAPARGSGGIGFGGALTIAFIVLNLTGVISWSWWWVLSPIWISALFWVVILLLAAIVAGVVMLINRR